MMGASGNQRGPREYLRSRRISLNFNKQVVGTASTAKTVQVTNSGAATLTISSILASGDFAIQGAGTTCGTPVKPNKSCNVGVTFTPTSTGTRNGDLTFTDNASDSPQTVSLTGTGILAVALSPASWNFGNQAAGFTSAAKAITLTNDLSTPLSISSIGASGDFAVASQSCGTGIAGGGSCTINVTFAPAALGNRTKTSEPGNPYSRVSGASANCALFPGPLNVRS
jgi:hypothetical protein